MSDAASSETRRSMVDIIREKGFLGKEFLTWLWFRSSVSGGVVRTGDGSNVSVSFERFIMLESGEGEGGETVTCRGLQASLSEGMAALAQGKKVSRAHIRIGSGEYEWKFTIAGSTFDISSLRVPATVEAGHDGDDDLSLEGRVLERGFMITTAVKTLDSLFHTFLAIRLSNDEWQSEKLEMRNWIIKNQAVS